MARVIVFDFDGVINSYKSGWVSEVEIPDPPVEGIREAIQEIRSNGYQITIVSTRCAYPGGKEAIESYLKKYEIEVDNICAEKPPAFLYVDDRALRFDGHPEKLMGEIQSFRPWWKK